MIRFRTDKPYGMFCVADFNHDRLPDLAVSDNTKGSESMDVYLNGGAGRLVKQASYEVGRGLVTAVSTSTP